MCVCVCVCVCVCLGLNYAPSHSLLAPFAAQSGFGHNDFGVGNAAATVFQLTASAITGVISTAYSVADGTSMWNRDTKLLTLVSPCRSLLSPYLFQSPLLSPQVFDMHVASNTPQDVTLARRPRPI